MDTSLLLDMAANERLAELPVEVTRLFDDIRAPPRLIAHSILVHDVAKQLTASLSDKLGDLQCDLDLVHFGAATHDIGKALEPAELSRPGKAHEKLGYDWLLPRAVEAKARFAMTHGMPADTPDLTVEDLLVMLADKVWKAKRDHQLEERLARELSQATDRDFWSVHLALNDIAEEIANGATRRLRWQGLFPAPPVASRP